MYCSCHRNNGYLWEILSSGILAKLSHSFVLVFNVQKKNCWTLEKTGTPFSRWMSGMPLLKVGYFLYFNPYLKAKEDIHKSLNWVHCKIMLLYGSYSPNVSFFLQLTIWSMRKFFPLSKESYCYPYIFVQMIGSLVLVPRQLGLILVTTSFHYVLYIFL